MKDIFELTADFISKNLIISKIFLKKIFEFNPRHQFLSLKTIFMLIPLLNYYFAEKQDGQKDMVELINHSFFKIVFLLLVK